MRKARRLRPLSFAKFQAILMAPVGLLAGVLYALGGAVYELATRNLNAGTALAFLALLGMPIAFAGIGFVAGIAEALLYNIFARWLGGLEVDFVRE